MVVIKMKKKIIISVCLVISIVAVCAGVYFGDSCDVVIDPGHGGKDYGAIYGNRNEKDDNLKIALLVKEKLDECKELINHPNVFVHSHNSIVVNLQNVVNFDKTIVTLQKNDKETVETYMSQRKYKEFKENFMKFIMAK